MNRRRRAARDNTYYNISFRATCCGGGGWGGVGANEKKLYFELFSHIYIYFFFRFSQRTKTNATLERVLELVDVPRGHGRSRVAERSTIHRNAVCRTVGLADTPDAQTTV